MELACLLWKVIRVVVVEIVFFVVVELDCL